MNDCSISDASSVNAAPPACPCILIVEDDADVAAALELLLETNGLSPAVATSAGEAMHRFGVLRPDVVLLDLNLTPGARSGDEGLVLLGRLLQQDPHAVVVVLTAHSGVAIAVQAMRSGAYDFVMKPWSNKKLAATLQAAATLRQARRIEALSDGGVLGSADLIGESESIQDNRRQALKAGRGRGNVLIVGEPGTGKARLSRMIHHLSSAPNGRFVHLDAAHLGTGGFAERFASILAGPKDGMPTETVLITRIDQLSRGDQEALSRQLAGLRELRESDVAAAPRVVATIETRRPRTQAMSGLKPDLMSQIGSFEIQTRPLRDRPEDVLPLARYFIERYSARIAAPARSMTLGCERVLLEQQWVGNVDTLRGMAERAVHTEEGDTLTPESFGLVTLPEVGQGEDLNLEKAEKALLEKALARHRYNVTLAARALGLTRAALYRRMERHEI